MRGSIEAFLETNGLGFGPEDIVCDTYSGWIQHRYEHNYTWKQLNGKLIMIDDMTSDHLRNTIRMLEESNHDYSDCEVLINMKYELNWRG